MGVLLLPLVTVQDKESTYDIRLHIKAENKHNMANILKRTLADMERVRRVAFDSS